MLKIQVLGQFALRWNGDLVVLPSRPAQSLFAYLALNPNITHRREKLYGMLWPDSSEENARGYLRSALWRIRKSLDQPNIPWADFLHITDIEVTLRGGSHVEVDAHRLLEGGANEDWTAGDLAARVSSYQGELLPGFYDEWVVLERERIRAAYQDKMRVLLELFLASQQWSEVLEWGERWIATGYAPETAYQALMIAHAGLGDSSSAAIVYRRCRDNLARELGIEPSDELRLLREQLGRGELPAPTHPLPRPDSPAIDDVPPVPGDPPYKGLAFFDVADTGRFFGREAPTSNVVRRLRDGKRLAIVIGASGSGKSSLVRAGLVPALRRGRKLPDGTDVPVGSAEWRILLLNPGSHPLESLALKLNQDETSLEATRELIKDMRRDPHSLHLAICRLAESWGAPRVVLVIDQFEEVFTLCRDEDERQAFIENIMDAVDPENGGPTAAVITLRADFYAHCADFPALREALARHQEFIGAMTTEELRRAIEQPATQAEWAFQSGLVDLLVRDVRGEPGALPLLSHALLETWRRRRGRTMTLRGYAESGGVRGAIARTAESVLRDMNPEERWLARNIFIRLTELGTETQDTRRRATISELIPSEDQEPAVRSVLDTLADARLVTLGQQDAEVAHEALIREWPTLREWLEEDRQGLHLHRHLTEAAQEWEARGRDHAELYRGARLAQAAEWANLHPKETNPLEREFLAASQTSQAEETAERLAQQQRELQAARDLARLEGERAQAERRSSVRLRRFAIALSGMLIVALAAAGFALQQRNRATSEALIARSRELASAALVQTDRDPELSVLLSIEAVAQSQAAHAETPRQVEETLRGSLMAFRTERVLAGHRDRVYEAAYSPDGSLLATASADGYVRIWDPSTGELIQTLDDGRRAIKSVAFSADGKILASTSNDRTIKIWDPKTGDLLRTLNAHTAMVQDLAYSPNGKMLASVGRDAALILWDLSTGKPTERFESPAPLMAVAFSPDGLKVAATSSGYGSEYSVWDIETGELLFSNMGEGVPCQTVGDFSSDLSFSPDGALLLVGDCQGAISVLSADDGSLLDRLDAHTGAINAIAFGPDGSSFAGAGSDRRVKVWNTATRELQLTLLGHQAPVYGLAFDPNGLRLTSTSEDGTARIWNISLPYEQMSIPTTADPVTISYSPDGTRIAAGYQGMGTVQVWDAATGGLVSSLAGHDEGSTVTGLAFNSDGNQLATSGSDQTVRLWDLSTGEETVPPIAHISWVQAVAFGPGDQALYTGASDTIVRQWSLWTGELQNSILGESDAVLSMALNETGSLLAVGDAGGLIVIHDLQANAYRTLESHQGSVYAVLFIPGGARLVSASDDGSIIIWDLIDRTPLMTLSGHDGPVLDLALSPDGATLASASLDGTVRLWDTETGRERLALEHPTAGGFFAVSFSPDGKTLAAAGQGGIFEYTVHLNDVVGIAKQRLTRDFTYDECTRYLSEPACRARLGEPETVSDILPPADPGRVCFLSEAGGVYDGGFGQRAYEGLPLVHQKLGWDTYVYEPEFGDDTVRGLQMMAAANCDLNVAAGYMFTSVFGPASAEHANREYMVLDASIENQGENLWGQTYAADQGAFLAGYVAASVTKTGVVGTFGAIQIPSVTDFMIGFEQGVRYFNQAHGTEVELVGWDTEKQQGDFVGDFCCPPEGKAMAARLISEGADIIMPVAGPWIGYGALMEVAQHEQTYFIGVDVDQVVATPDFASSILTSVEKRLDISVLHAAQAIEDGTFAEGPHVGTLATGEVGLSPFYDNRSLIPQAVLAELEQVKSDIAAGRIHTKPE